MIKNYDGISVGTIQRRRRAPVEKFLQLEAEIPSETDLRQFGELASAFQEEICLLREASRGAAEVLRGLCNLWLIDDHV